MATNFSLPTHSMNKITWKPLDPDQSDERLFSVNSEDMNTTMTTAAVGSSNLYPHAEYDSPRLQDSPSSPVKIRIPSMEALQPRSARFEDLLRRKDFQLPSQTNTEETVSSHLQQHISEQDGIPIFSGFVTSHQETAKLGKGNGQRSSYVRSDMCSETSFPTEMVTKRSQRSETPTIYLTTQDNDDEALEQPRLQYFHSASDQARPNKVAARINHKAFEGCQQNHSLLPISTGGHSKSAVTTEAANDLDNVSRPSTPQILGSDLYIRGRSLSPAELGDDISATTSGQHRRDPSNTSSRRSFDPKQTSYIDLLNIPYTQQLAQQNVSLDNAKLRASVGTNASLLDTKKTLEMYRANVKKTNDPAVQYEFALFMVNAAQDTAIDDLSDKVPSGEGVSFVSVSSRTELLREARQILQKLADKSYVFAQYYLADGYASGLFNNGREDYERGFPLFLSAAKHGHAEAGYRTALCYEFGWGSRKDFAKAVQFYRQAATKNHPGAAIRLGKACLTGDMGLYNKYKEGVKWLKRAAESADVQHNSGPFELGLLHLTGYGEDVFKDEAYAAQLFTKSAELCHPEANLRMGEAYEHGLLTCPRDPALSIHFYTGAAQAGVPRAMMALCAWYMVGAEPLLNKNEEEAYEWAKRAATSGFSKAEYAVGYFTEMGIGCRRDPLEANVWYVKAADHGDERAKQRLAIIREAETGDIDLEVSSLHKGRGLRKKRSNVKGNREEKDCLVM